MNDLIFRFFAKKMLKILKERIQNRQGQMLNKKDTKQAREIQQERATRKTYKTRRTH